MTVEIIRLIALTGCRRSEIIGSMWDEVDLDASCLRLVDSKEGDSVRPMGLPVVECLRAWRNAIVRLNKAAQGKGCPLGSLASELANDSEPARKRLTDSFSMWRERIRKWLHQDAGARRT